MTGEPDLDAIVKVLAEHADQVDRDAAFPVKNLGLLRANGLLGLLVPVEHGGSGKDLAEFAETARLAGGACPQR